MRLEVFLNNYREEAEDYAIIAEEINELETWSWMTGQQNIYCINTDAVKGSC